ncbi:MAG TPA: CaiB/BaiF CoA-transferase family protein [Burkholderiales bacterium]|nr:CaiB/BaiF CoA-transferase family protein [Burkholderiales bacterium]
MAGPLAGIKVLEFESIGPAPFAGMLLADMGADVLVIDRPAGTDLGLKRERWYDTMMRGKRSATLDLKNTTSKEVIYSLAEKADALIEGMRPGVMERLGIGPDEMLKINPKLVYGRMTGWGQTGPLASRAGHDINYIALTGILNAIGRKGEAPLPPLNLVGDFGGGGMLLGFGVACGLLEASRSGKGQVIDAAMVEGASLLATMFHGFLNSNQMNENRGSNILDSGAPWYNVYETKDGKHVSIGAIEERFYQEFLKRMQLAEADFPQHDRAKWPLQKAAFTAAFKAKTRDEWVKVFEGSDACFAPVLSWSEAPRHPHNRARSAFVSVKRVEQPAPAPRFSRTPPEVRLPPPERGEGGAQALAEWGFDAGQVKRLTSLGLGFGEKK